MRPVVMSGVSQDSYGSWFWWTIDDVGFYEKRAVGVQQPLPLGNPWRAAWTRAKHLRRAAQMYGSQAEQRCRYLADMPLDDPGQDIASAHDYECAYYEAAENADWGTGSHEPGQPDGDGAAGHRHCRLRARRAGAPPERGGDRADDRALAPAGAPAVIGHPDLDFHEWWASDLASWLAGWDLGVFDVHYPAGRDCCLWGEV